MRKDTVWVAIACLFLGGTIGYLLGVQVSSKETQQTATGHRQDQPGSSVTAAPSSDLPGGTPSIATAADIETLKKAVEAAPQNGTLAANLANKYYDAGRYEEAIRYYQQALALDPNSVSIITDLGTALFYSGHPDEAIAQYNHSLQIDPSHVQSLHNLVIVNIQGKKDAAAARAALDRLKSVAPRDPSIGTLEVMITERGSVGPSGQASQPGSNVRQRIF